MTKGLVSALCLTAQTVLCTPMAGASELTLSGLVAWTDHVGEIMRSLEEDLTDTGRSFLEEHFRTDAAQANTPEADWQPAAPTKSSRDLRGLSLSTEGSSAGLVLRF